MLVNEKKIYHTSCILHVLQSGLIPWKIMKTSLGLRIKTSIFPTKYADSVAYIIIPGMKQQIPPYESFSYIEFPELRRTGKLCLATLTLITVPWSQIYLEIFPSWASTKWIRSPNNVTHPTLLLVLIIMHVKQRGTDWMMDACAFCVDRAKDAV